MARVTIKEAAKRLGIPEQSLRCWIVQKTCPFGYIIRDGSRRTYYINEAELRQFINGESAKC